MSVYDYVKGKETKPCPISSDTTGNMVVKGLYMNPVVAWREAECDVGSTSPGLRDVFTPRVITC